VAVGVQGDGHSAVAKAFADDLGVHPRAQHQRGAGFDGAGACARLAKHEGSGATKEVYRL
jgi:hypothetical protein